MKLCPGCKKPTNKRLKNGRLQSWCDICASRYRKEYYKRNKKKQSTLNKKRRFEKEYGLTVEQYQELIRKQGGKCAICEVVLINPHMDHNHKTRTPRGVLCMLCNHGLGSFQEDTQRMEKAIQYLLTYAR